MNKFMQTLFDFFPVLLFFICFKLSNIYLATGVAMVASVLQVIIYRIRYQRFETLQLVSMSMIMVLGGLTLFFHNPWFIKWKPTVIYWLTAIVLLCSSFFSPKSLVQKLMESNIQLPSKIWSRLNYSWVIFFSSMGLLNIYVAYNFDTDTWVNFKLFGGTGCLVLFILIQAYFLTRYQLPAPNQTNSS
jgi:intracellular septation protein